jgi:HD-like signal output (HDOD) protein
MTTVAQQWVDRLANETLPVMQRTLTQVRDLLNQASVNHHNLAEVISRDPGFSLYIIRQFNGLPNAPQEPVKRIELAIPLLGMARVEQASRTLPCLEDRLQGPPRQGLIDCYSRAAHAAIYASALATRRRDADEGSVYTAALLHDIAEMALWSQQPQRMRQILKLVQQGDGYEEAAMEVFGCSLQEISSGLSRAWQLPDLVRDAQGHFNSYQPRPLTVMLASALARETSLGWLRQRTHDHLELLAEFLETPLDQVLAWFHTQAAAAARQLQRLPIPLPAFHLIHDGSPLTQPVPRKPQPQSIPVAEKPAPAAAEAHAPTPAPASAAKPASPLQQLISTTLQEICGEQGLQRAMFAMLNTDKTTLRARLVSEESAEGSLKGFKVDLATPTLFSLLLKKPQAISLSPSNAQKYQHMIPAPLHAVINPRQFLAMSVFLRNKPIGLFYADNGPKGAITPRQFANFKAVCQRTIKALS